MKTAIRVLIADDNLAVRRSLMLLLGSTPGMELVGQASHGQQAVDLCEAVLPDVLVLDLNMPGMSGIDILRRIQQTCPQVRVLVLTGSTDRNLLRDALEAGASTCFMKDVSGDQLLVAIRMAATSTIPGHEDTITA